MIYQFFQRKSGNTAIEFALIAPVLFFIMLISLVVVLAFWTKSGLQESSEKTARCVAIRSVLCAGIPADCDSGIASICYAETAAKQRGITNVVAKEVSLNTADVIGGVSFTTVTIAHPLSLAGYTFVLTVTSSFPNNN